MHIRHRFGKGLSTVIDIFISVQNIERFGRDFTPSVLWKRYEKVIQYGLYHTLS